MNIEQRVALEYQQLVDTLEKEGLDYQDITTAMMTLLPMVLYYNMSQGLGRPTTYKDVKHWSKTLSKTFRRCMLEAHEKG